jgi:hypothetical protein
VPDRAVADRTFFLFAPSRLRAKKSDRRALLQQPVAIRALQFRRQIVGADRDMLGFETLTLCPIERSLIVAELLTAAERDYSPAL